MRRHWLPAVVLATCLALPGPAGAVVRPVDDDGQATETDCDAAGAVSTTIQGAVNAATSGIDSVKVCPGAYHELVTVNKSLVLTGPQAGVDARNLTRTGLPDTEAVVDGSGPMNQHTTAFNVTASEVTIDGFTMQDAADPNQFGAAVVLGQDTSSQTFENNIVRESADGLFLGSDTTIIRRNVFATNNAGGGTSGVGLLAGQTAAGLVLNDVTIDSNRFSANLGVALSLNFAGSSRATHITVSNNTFDNNGTGFRATNTTDSEFSGNVLTGSTASQVLLGNGVSDLTVTENMVHNGQARGVRVLQLISGPVATGITLRCNSISGNTIAGLDVEDAGYSGELAAPVNWWGNASGPAIASNPSGTGQPLEDPGGHVAYLPFLVDDTDADPMAPGFQCGTPALSVADVTKAEGTGSATTSFDFAVTLDRPSASPVTVAYATADGTAGAGRDYSSSSDTLTFAPGERLKTVTVPVTGDAADEPDETFKLKLLGPSGAALADGEALATIQDDDLPADRRKPKVGLVVVKGSRLGKALSKGLALNLKTDEVGTAAVVARVSGARVGSVKRKLTRVGRHRLVIKFGAKQRKKFKASRRLKLSLNATVADAAGNVGRKTLKVALKR